MSTSVHRPIQILSPLVAERIAAGEVIERPSSVVKELIENSLDAGATEVSVALEDGGKSLIEILDNGRGMSPEDLALCIKRHATSKLQSLDDLEKISTLGFRGEALPSIAAVSDLNILSRTAPSQAGVPQQTYALQLPRHRPEVITFGHFLGSPHGTRIQARNLFSQIPARLKFLKSQASEVGHVREWIERLALTHPHVGFRLSSDGRILTHLRPQEETARIKSILSDGDDYPIVSATSEHEFGTVRVHWLQGLSTPQTRKLIQVVNGRALRDRVLQQALLLPFRQLLLPGQFPAVVLFFEISPHLIDVNVHPTKTEVRFLESNKIFRAIENTVASLVTKHGAPSFAAGGSSHAWKAAEPTSSLASTFGNTFTPQPGFSFRSMPPNSPPDTGNSDSALDSLTLNLAATASPQPGSAENTSTFSDAAWLFRPENYAGAIFQTYLLYDLGEELGLIDQHAAHERIRYEKLRQRVLHKTSADAQALLIPEAVHFKPENRAVLEKRLGWLLQLGFEAEIFGDEALLFRTIPGEWGTDSLRTRLKNLVERLLAHEDTSAPGRTPLASEVLLDETLFESLASEACHSAIRAGQRIRPDEAKALVDELFRCENPWNCPHGRPTVVRVPRARFEEWFKRRV